MLVRSLLPADLLRLNRVNLDTYTANFSPYSYFNLLSEYPDQCACVEALDGGIMGYVTGKIEYDMENYQLEEESWHGHISAISVGVEYRGLGVADVLLSHFVDECFRHKAKFVDLYVFAENEPALKFYNRHRFEKHSTCENYYGPGRDAYELRLYPPSS